MVKTASASTRPSASSSVSPRPLASRPKGRPSAKSVESNNSAQAQLVRLALVHAQVLHALDLDGVVDAKTLLGAMRRREDDLEVLLQQRNVRECVIQDVLRLYAESEQEIQQELRQWRNRVGTCCSIFCFAVTVVLLLIASGLFFSTFQYEKGDCRLAFYTNDSCQHENSCFFEVSVSFDGEILQLPAWRLPVEDWEMNPGELAREDANRGKQRFDLEGPFRCCNNAVETLQARERERIPNKEEEEEQQTVQKNEASLAVAKQAGVLGAASDCCSLRDDFFLFCDNWGVHFPHCPKTPWACRVVVEDHAGKRVVKEVSPWVDPPSAEFLLAAGVSFGLAIFVQTLPRVLQALNQQLLVESKWSSSTSCAASIKKMTVSQKPEPKLTYSEEGDENSDASAERHTNEDAVRVVHQITESHSDSPTERKASRIGTSPIPVSMSSETQKEKTSLPSKHSSARSLSRARRSRADAVEDFRKPEPKILGKTRSEPALAVVHHQHRDELQRNTSSYTRRNSERSDDADWGPGDPTLRKVFQPLITPAATMDANWRRNGWQSSEAHVDHARKTLERQRLNAMQMSQGQVQWLHTTAALRKSALEHGNAAAPLIHSPLSATSQQQGKASSRVAQAKGTASSRAAQAKALFAAGRGRGRHLDRQAGLQAPPRKSSI